MIDCKIVRQVSRKPKPMTGALRKAMAGFATLFVILGAAVHRAFLLPGFLLALLYFVYDVLSQRDYEYAMDGSRLAIDVILGKRYRRRAHTLDLGNIEVVAPSSHPAVARYKKGGSEKLPKYDYTSYDDDVPYYTMIVTEGCEKKKLLLDLDGPMLEAIRRRYPEKAYLS